MSLLNAESLGPALTVNDLQQSIKFYTDGLGFEIVHRGEVDGKLKYVTMTAGNARLSIGQDDFAKGRDRSKGTGMRMWLTIKEDLNVVAARIKAVGYKLDEEPTKMPWGAVVFTLTDPDGFKFSFDNPR